MILANLMKNLKIFLGRGNEPSFPKYRFCYDSGYLL
jgi:hypothetical protein